MGQYDTVAAMLDGDVATLDRERLGAGVKLGNQSNPWDPDMGRRIPSASTAALGLMILGR